MSNRVIPVFSQYFDGNGDPLSGGKLYFYENKSSTVKQDTFKDPELTIVNTNPVVLDGEGRAGNIYGEGVYRVIITDSNDVQIDVKDNINSSTLVVNNPSDAVNSISITNTTTGEAPIIASVGQDTDVGMRIKSQAAGPISLEVGSGVIAELDIDGLTLEVGSNVIAELGTNGLTLGNSGATVNIILDEDNMVSDDDSALATQQSIKAYVDSLVVPAASQAEQEAGSESGKYVAPATQQYHQSAAKFWVNYDTVTTTVIMSSYNVASLVDLGTGRTQINIAVDFSNEHYVISGMAGDDDTTNRQLLPILDGVKLVGRVDISIVSIGATTTDADDISIIGFGDQ